LIVLTCAFVILFGSGSTFHSIRLRLGLEADKPTTVQTLSQSSTVASAPFVHEEPVVPPAENDWLVVPGRRVGQITPDVSEADLIRLFGKENVKRGVVYSYEGIDVQGAFVSFPDSNNNLRIEWQDEANLRYPGVVFIDHEGTKWKTVEGVTVGTSLEELERINGKPFNIYGFEIDWYLVGTIKSWEGGKLEGLGLQLSKTKEVSDQEYQSVLGDGGYSSSNPVIRKMDMRVATLQIGFPKK
jgi:hypothetical protein